MDAQFGSIEGVTKTRVGYTGGTTKNPTYRNLGDHTEAVQIEFDPKQVSYRKLADLFWNSHNPQDRSGSRQYMTAVFYHTEEQKRVILEAQARSSSEATGKIFTQVLPASIFYPAEEYHQHYYKKNPLRYNYYRYSCGRDQRLQELWGSLATGS